MRNRPWWQPVAPLALLLLAGCASPPVETLRSNYFRGDYDRALLALQEWPEDHRDSVLCYLERGMVHHANGDYAASTQDWLDAVAISEKLDYLSVTKSGGTLVVNDQIRDYRGAPFERSLCRAFLALNFMAQGKWDSAAVEGRNIEFYQQNMADYPEDPFSRYIAGLSFEMIGDRDNARIQYEHADRVSSYLNIDPTTGQLRVDVSGEASAPEGTKAGGRELICIASMGRTRGAPAWYGNSPYVEVEANGRTLGRTLPLSNTSRLWHETRKKKAAMETARSVTRIVLKESAAHALEKENEFAGELLRLLLFATEVPDERRWETLPLWLSLGRMPCPEKPGPVTLNIRAQDGRLIRSEKVTPVYNRAADLYVVFSHAQQRR